MYSYKNSIAKQRYMEINLEDEQENKSYNLHIIEPKLKTFRLFEKLDDDSTIDDMLAVLSVIISNNKEHIKFDADYISEIMDMSDCAQFFDDFSEWIANRKSTDPN